MKGLTRQNLLKFIQKWPDQSLRVREWARSAKVTRTQDKKFRHLMGQLIADGLLKRHRDGRVRLAAKSTQSSPEMEGRLEVTRRGFGFAIVEGRQDVFIMQNNLGGGVTGDTVKLRIRRGRPGKGPEGAVTAVIRRYRTHLVGTLEEAPGGFELEPLEALGDRVVRVQRGKWKEVRSGDLVVAKVNDWGSAGSPIRATVEEIIGRSDDPHTDFTLVLRQHDLEEAFPAKVEEEVAALAKSVRISAGGERRDLRKLTILTIDPATAKDFDDALSLEKLDADRWRLGVHIADVSLYVTPGSHTDAEAYRRANSVYFHEGVVPMLPHLLSSNLCSLRPNEDRPAVSAMITLNAAGEVLETRFHRSLIHSKQRFSYEEVHDILAAGKGPHYKILADLKILTRTLFKNRVAQGSVDFDIPEPLFELDDFGVPHQIHPSQRLDSHRIVEECMLLANRLVAEKIPAGKPRWPFLYRVHDEPGEGKMADLSSLLKRLNLPGLPRGQVTSAVVRDLLLAMEETPYRDLIENLTLRSMAKAAYAKDNLGHFGLAFPMYAHFTSPIRRYADLAVHRMVTERVLHPGGPPPITAKTLTRIAAQCTAREIVGVKAERAYRRLKELRYLATQLDKIFTGIISGVIARGLFVQLQETLVDGFVSIERLDDDSYEYDERLFALRGRRTKRLLQLGQEVTIRVADVSVERRLAEFTLVDDA